MLDDVQDDVNSAGSSCADVLIVDDNAANLIAFEAALGSIVGQVFRAQSGEQALRILLERDFALILLDVQMPSLDGLQTARMIRERRRSRHTPIIFVTAYGREEQDVLEAYKLGAVDFLFKPVVAEILQSKVGVFVDLQRRTFQVMRQSEQLREHERREHARLLDEERQRWDQAALRRQLEELAEADRRKDEFLAVLSHELRNPLSAIVVGCELLMRKLTAIPGVDEAALRTRDRIDRQAQYLRRLVDDLLDVARINSGKIELKVAPTTLQHIVDQALVISLAAIEERGHKLEVKVPSASITLVVDAVRMTQAVSNLLNNAARYTERGGLIRLECEIVEAAKLGEEEPMVEIQVSDNGRGIAVDRLPRVFDIFVQENPAGSAPGNGLGLGLTIVKRLVEMHDGRVAAASQGVGTGSTFTITLPVDSIGVSTPDDNASTASRRTTSRPLSIVLVEDNDDIRESMSELLSSLGHSVQAADDGATGAELIVKVSPDVAIVDVGLPSLDGYQVAAHVRNALGPESVRLVAMTGYGQDTDRQRARAAGFDEHLVKPADVNTLIDLLSNKGK